MEEVALVLRDEDSSFLNIKDENKDNMRRYIKQLELIILHPNMIEKELLSIRDEIMRLSIEKTKDLEVQPSMLSRIKMQSQQLVTYKGKERDLYKQLYDKREDLKKAKDNSYLAKCKLKLTLKLLEENGVDTDGIVSYKE